MFSTPGRGIPWTMPLQLLEGGPDGRSDRRLGSRWRALRPACIWGEGWPSATSTTTGGSTPSSSPRTSRSSIFTTDGTASRSLHRVSPWRDQKSNRDGVGARITIVLSGGRCGRSPSATAGEAINRPVIRGFISDSAKRRRSNRSRSAGRPDRLTATAGLPPIANTGCARERALMSRTRSRRSPLAPGALREGRSRSQPQIETVLLEVADEQVADREEDRQTDQPYQSGESLGTTARTAPSTM